MSVTLMERNLWKEFDAQCNEMIITKIGRNLFPILEYSFAGLNEFQNYQIGIRMQPTSGNKLKFVGGRWEPLEVMEDVLEPNEVLMPKFKTGRELMSRGLKVEKLKLTNTKEALMKNDQMIRVQSMRQYLPILTIYEIVGMGELRIFNKFQFLETKFIAVTAYQSDPVKNLKVQRNKFAQGFREGSRVSTKRPQSTSSSTSPSSVSTSSDSPESTKTSKSTRTEENNPMVPVTMGYGSGLVEFGNFQNFPTFPGPQLGANWPYPYNYNQQNQNFESFSNFSTPNQNQHLNSNLNLNPEIHHSPPTFYEYGGFPFGGYPWNG